MQFKPMIYAFALLAGFGLALGGCSSSSDDPPEMEMTEPTDEERQAMIASLVAQINALREALGLDPVDIDALQASVAELTAQVATLQQQVADAAAEAERVAQEEADRLAAEEAARLEAEREAAEEAAAEMAALAAKLYAGIGAPDASAGNAAQRQAVYSGTNDVDITVTWGAADTAQALTADEDATVADHHGWTGQMFTAAPTGGGTYEAVVYSNVGEPTMGAKFNSGDGADGVGFNLDTDSTDTVTLTGVLNLGPRIASPSFTHSAGSHTFELPEDNPRGETTIPITGTYYGVSGTYTCTPGTGACTVNKAAEGYTFANPGAWTFTATDPAARVMEMPDADYASYGWWLHKSSDGKTFIASAFVDEKGTVAAASGITALAGTARYVGGATGKYALSSSTGGTNDAGHFTADAEIEANFNTDMISGTIDNFVGADGEPRDWSVALNETDVSDGGVIDGTDTANAQVGTVWTIGETAAAKSGQWSGDLWENGDDLVPQVATGTFHSAYGLDGQMVGAFGANKE